MTTLHMGIASYEEMKARTLAIAAGELTLQADDPKVWQSSFEQFAAVLSSPHRTLLRVIHRDQPESIQALAGSTGRTTRSLSRTLRSLERYGLVRLHRGPRGQVRPEAPFNDVQVTLSLQQGTTQSAAPDPGMFGAR